MAERICQATIVSMFEIREQRTGDFAAVGVVTEHVSDAAMAISRATGLRLEALASLTYVRTYHELCMVCSNHTVAEKGPGRRRYRRCVACAHRVQVRS